jgi:hypothetical protein
MIVKKENKWLVMDSAGKKILGTHYSHEDAKDQLAAIEISKKKQKVEESPNFLNNSMNTLTEYYKKICEDLKTQIIILEKKIKDKKAKKDYDGDGKVESGTKEYLDSRSKAIEKSIAKKEGKKLEEELSLNSMRRKARDIGGVPLPEPSRVSAELDRMRKKADTIGGIPMSSTSPLPPDVNGVSPRAIPGLLKLPPQRDGLRPDLLNSPIDRAYRGLSRYMAPGSDAFSAVPGGAGAKFGETSVSPSMTVRPGGGYSTTTGLNPKDVDVNDQLNNLVDNMGLDVSTSYRNPRTGELETRVKTDQELASDIVSMLGGGGGGMFGAKGRDPRGKNKNPQSRNRRPFGP